MSATPKTDARLQAEAIIVLLCQLDRDNAALRRDKERLDWLARNRSVSATERPLSVTPESLRAAIDAAMQEANP